MIMTTRMPVSTARQTLARRTPMITRMGMNTGTGIATIMATAIRMSIMPT